MPKHLFTIPPVGTSTLMSDELIERVIGNYSTNENTRGTLPWIRITTVITPIVGFKYIAMDESGNRNDFYFAPNGKWYHSEDIYEKYPQKSLDGIVYFLNN